MFYWDPTYILVIIGLLISLGASAMVNSAMRKYHQVHNSKGITGAECARRILDNEGLYQVQVEDLGSNGGDHFDPQSNVVRLSHQNYSGRSITAMGVAAHECGHAIQHAQGYTPIRIRSALVPVVNIGSNASMPLILLGVVLSWNQLLIQLGIIAFALTVVFQLATLPVEFNASGRALERLEHCNGSGEQGLPEGAWRRRHDLCGGHAGGGTAASAFDPAFRRRTPQGRLRVERQKEEGYG